METPPRLLVAISIDQFSADLFQEYRNRFAGGFARLLDGGVFPSGYQSHAATETCPGHSTLMTGMRPEHTGIVANNWLNLGSTLADKKIYCVEDETVPGSTHEKYTVDVAHLLVPTLGERMKAANTASRNVSVSGKDRAAVMMGGHDVDQLWWWNGQQFVTYAGRSTPDVVARANRVIGTELAEAQPALELPDYCVPRAQPIAVKPGLTVGDGRFARAAGDEDAFRASPELDGATLAVAGALVQSMKLGQGSAPDMLNISLSATDYVGHAYGTQGSEMCLQLASLDRDLGDFFAMLDRTGVDYAVVLSADHGGIDLPERLDQEAMPMAKRADKGFDAQALSKSIAAKLGLAGDPLRSSDGIFYVDPSLSGAQRAAVIREAKAMLLADPDVAAVFTADEIAAAPEPSGPPETWPLIERAKASFYRPRSGDLVVALKPRISPIEDPGKGYVATHGSFWDYDRRVPILFWRKGMTPFEQPLSVETVDIAPTLAALIHLPLAAPKMDGRCLDLDAGAASTCP
ncbi:alkaline phosphatase family protein [Hephaestia mangrovi]|uniref:alkaline phosphatase family protein n=1 Tax=Hephaestia mangrovi TaxID=2873268 RepID=UPI001CA72683|nr:alkaline phosphatase family protein [Hephaestia mangrovi]MBY8827706.1 alkaline phosphatase family protein [Hephaestia mangrovi]